jgi:hypothetical protein
MDLSMIDSGPLANKVRLQSGKYRGRKPASRDEPQTQWDGPPARRSLANAVGRDRENLLGKVAETH